MFVYVVNSAMYSKLEVGYSVTCWIFLALLCRLICSKKSGPVKVEPSSVSVLLCTCSAHKSCTAYGFGCTIRINVYVSNSIESSILVRLFHPIC